MNTDNGYSSTELFVFTGTLERDPVVLEKVLYTTITINRSDHSTDLSNKSVDVTVFARNHSVYDQIRAYRKGDQVTACGKIEHRTYKGKPFVQLVISSFNTTTNTTVDTSHLDYVTLDDLYTNDDNQLTHTNQTNLHDEDSELFPEQFSNNHVPDHVVTNTGENITNADDFIDDFFAAHVKENKEYLQNGNKDAKPDLEYTDRLEGEKDSISKMFDNEKIL